MTSSLFGGILGHLWASWAIFGPSWCYLGPSWDHFGASWKLLGVFWGHSGATWRHLGASWGHLRRKLFQVVSSCFKLFQVVFKLFQVAAASWGHLGAFGGSWEALACFFGLLLKHGSSFTKTFKNQWKSRVFGSFWRLDRIKMSVKYDVFGPWP